MSKPFLEIEHLNKDFGGLRAVKLSLKGSRFFVGRFRMVRGASSGPVQLLGMGIAVFI